MSDCFWPHGLQPTRLLCPWNSSGKNTGEGCHSLFQGIFLTQRLNLGFLHCRQILYHLSHQGRPPKYAPLSMELSRQEYWNGLYYSFLQGILLSQRLNPGLLHCRQILYCLSLQGIILRFFLKVLFEKLIYIGLDGLDVCNRYYSTCMQCARGSEKWNYWSKYMCVHNFDSESHSVVSNSCDPMDSATPWTLHGILQARILEWVAFPFSRGSSQPGDRI